MSALTEREARLTSDVEYASHVHALALQHCNSELEGQLQRLQQMREQQLQQLEELQQKDLATQNEVLRTQLQQQQERMRREIEEQRQDAQARVARVQRSMQVNESLVGTLLRADAARRTQLDNHTDHALQMYVEREQEERKLQYEAAMQANQQSAQMMQTVMSVGMGAILPPVGAALGSER
jgi:hypothetical protein